MKNLILNLITGASIICSSCSTVAYLPDINGIAKNQYGSYIEILLVGNYYLKGELIAVNPKKVFVLKNDKNFMQLDSVSLTEIKNFTLRYAKGKAKNYAWTIPASAAITISHGWFLIFSLPINLLTTTIVTTNAGSSFAMNKYDIMWDELSKFARFPQGIPPNIQLKDIK